MTAQVEGVDIGPDGLRVLKNLRQALCACWNDEHARGGNPALAHPSAFMCRLTVRSILATVGAGPFAGVAGTLRTPDGRSGRDHAWLDDGAHIFDLTADQFGYPDIVVCASPDERRAADAGATRSLARLVAEMPADACWPGAPDELQAGLREAIAAFVAWHGPWAGAQACARVGQPSLPQHPACPPAASATRPRLHP